MQAVRNLAGAGRGGYSLVDTLIAATILGIALSAACSLTLGMSTQEEIGWRVSRGTALLDGACALYGLGLTTAQAAAVLPTDPQAAVTYGAQASETISGLQMQAVDVSVTITTTNGGTSWTPGAWTGGGDLTARQRTTTLRVYRSPFQLKPFP